MVTDKLFCSGREECSTLYNDFPPKVYMLFQFMPDVGSCLYIRPTQDS